MDKTPTHYPKPSLAYSATAELTVELAKMLALVAPSTMNTEQQELWLRAAVDALDDIRAEEVRAISSELRRSVTRHNQIVPEISKLVAEKRARSYRADKPESPYAAELQISREAQFRRGKSTCQAEVEAAWKWERDERIAAGLPVAPIEPPLTRKEISNLSPAMVRMGLTCGALAERDGQIVNGGDR